MTNYLLSLRWNPCLGVDPSRGVPSMKDLIYACSHSFESVQHVLNHVKCMRLDLLLVSVTDILRLLEPVFEYSLQ